MTATAYVRLEERFKRIAALDDARGMLGWDHYGMTTLYRLARHIDKHGFKTPEERKKAA